MLPPTDQLTICFAHVAYRLRERFLPLATGIESFEVRDGAAREQQIGEADVLVISGLCATISCRARLPLLPCHARAFGFGCRFIKRDQPRWPLPR